MQQRKMNRNMLDNYGGDVSHMRQMGGGGSSGYGSHGGGGGNYSNLREMGGFSNNQMGGYGGQGNQGYGGQGVLGSSPGLSGSGGGYGMGSSGSSGGLDMDALLQQRQLQQQLSLRESQLALANSLLLQQQQQGIDVGPGMHGGRSFNMGGMDRGLMMNKRRGDMNQGDMRSDYNKRPRRDFRSPPGNRDRRRSREYEGGNGGNRNSGYRRNQNSSSSSSRPGRSLEQNSAKAKATAEEVYDPEKPTSDEDDISAGDKKKGGGNGEKKDQFYCHVCKINCRDGSGFRMHMNGARHKKRMVDVLAEHQEKSTQLVQRMKAEEHLRKIEVKDKPSNKQFCKTCDQEVNVRLVDHYRHVVHRKRLVQVNRGCGWCHTGSFKNFSEVLAHRETKEHKEQQAMHEKEGRKDRESDEGRSRSPRSKTDKGRESSKAKSPRAGGSDKRSDKGRGSSKDDNIKKEPVEIKVELPAKLQKFDPNTAVGQNCIVPVTGFFCKLCNKFYNNEAAAKDTHCKTEPHFTKYQKFVYAKLKAKAEADQAAAEKAAAEKAAAEAKEKAEKEAESKKEGEDAEVVAVDNETMGENTGTSKTEAAENEESQMEDDEEEGEGEENTNEENEEGADEEEMDEDHDENAILAEDGSAVLDSFYNEEEEEELLNQEETGGSMYATAGDDSMALESASTTANDTADAGCKSGASLGTTEVSLQPGASISEFLAETSQNDDEGEGKAAESGQNDDGGDAEDQGIISVSGDIEGDGSQHDEDGEDDVATIDTPSSVTRSSPRASSTPTRGRGGSRGTNKAKRGRKVAK